MVSEPPEEARRPLAFHLLLGVFSGSAFLSELLECDLGGGKQSEMCEQKSESDPECRAHCGKTHGKACFLGHSCGNGEKQKTVHQKSKQQKVGQNAERKDVPRPLKEQSKGK